MTDALKQIIVTGANEHNLQNVHASIPRDKLIVVTGVSGSGKSSLAFDTLFAEGQRKYMESLSSYARQFLTQMRKPDVESIEGLPPTIAIAQRSASHNPRSTVATTTEIYDYLRLLMARCGTPHCWHVDKKGIICGNVIETTSLSQIILHITSIKKGTKLMLCAPVIVGKKGYHRDALEDLRSQGFVRARVNGKIVDLREVLLDESDNPLALGRYEMHTIEAVVDRIVTGPEGKDRIADSAEVAARLSGGSILVLTEHKNGWKETRYSENFACAEHPECSIPSLEPRLFSFNSHFGACKRCDGLGSVHEFDPALLVPDESKPIAKGALEPWHRAGPAMRRRYRKYMKKFCEMVSVTPTTPYTTLTSTQKKLVLYGGVVKGSRVRFVGVIPELERRFKETESDNVRNKLLTYMTKMTCPDCNGQRIKTEARHVTVQSDKGEHSISEIASMTIAHALERMRKLKLSKEVSEIAEPILKEIINRLTFLVSVGLDYLSLNRTSGTLSGGEAQRIRLATQVGSGLVGVCYVLDEPTIGLHARDTQRLLKTLRHLSDIGNTVIIVEHDEGIIRKADHLIDVGPRAGIHGGTIVAQGTLRDIVKTKGSLTGEYLSGKSEISQPEHYRSFSKKKQVSIFGARKNNLKEIDVQIPLGCLVCFTGVSGSGKSSLVNGVLLQAMQKHVQKKKIPATICDKIVIADEIDRVIEVDQSPIGRTPRSNPATYTGIFGGIRSLFAQTKEARIRGYKPGRFSFNVKGGRCEACQGQGLKKIEMHFLPDAFVTCEECEGSRYNAETLEVKWRGYTICELLNTTIEDAVKIFESHGRIERMLQCLIDVGLGYLTLGQPSTTLSGGEAQRVKLASELGVRTNNHSLYILDEPTTGLHFADIDKLIEVIQRLVNAGNSVAVIEHNLDVIKCADWLIDLGPEGGSGGGTIVATGTPKEVSTSKKSHTGKVLAEEIFTSKKQ